MISKSSSPGSIGAVDHEPIHNVFTVTPNLISGSQPEGDAGFEALREKKVKTILSVDGATPDVEAAHRFGMRYVHLPIGYHGIDRDRQWEIARVVRDLPGPVYIHCHHGKHRGPAAAASAAVALGEMTADEAVEFMEAAKTSKSYPGLYNCVQLLSAVSSDELDIASNMFPEQAPVPGFVKAMSQLQSAFDHLEEIRDAGWKTPDHHPDLVPLAEAGQLENLLRGLVDDPENGKHPADFAEMMRNAWQASVSLEKAMESGATHADLTKRLAVLGQSCKDCHSAYRDIR